jgi:hypothetical protein
VRIWIYVHLTAVVIFWSFNFVDRWISTGSHNSAAIELILYMFLLPALLAWPLCPVFVLIALARGTFTCSQVAVSILAEAILVIAQFVVLSPACS